MNTAATAQAQKDIELAVMGYTLQLCEALRQNYINYSIKSQVSNVKEIRLIHVETEEEHKVQFLNLLRESRKHLAPNFWS
jgi:hypothetical protein